MKLIGIVTNEEKDHGYLCTGELEKEIRQNGMQSVRLSLVKEGEDLHVVVDETVRACDSIVVLGGDGTLLRVAGDLYGLCIPLLGVNLGNLGYLTEVDATQIKEAVKKLADGSFFTEERMMLKAEVVHEASVKGFALNDITISRIGQIRILTIKLFVNGKLLHTYEADGLILSTPTGSTAYNLSAGGPVVEPTTSMLVVTPICSHQRGIHSIVLSGDDVVEAEIGPARRTGSEEACIAADGAILAKLVSGEKIRISKAEHTTELLRLSDMSFLETLRRKMD